MRELFSLQEGGEEEQRRPGAAGSRVITECLEQGAEIAAASLCSYTDREGETEKERTREATCDREIAKTTDTRSER